MLSIARMTPGAMEEFVSRYPAFRDTLATEVEQARLAWLAEGKPVVTVDAAAQALWRRGVKKARAEEAFHALQRVSPADIGWDTRRRREAEQTAAAGKAAKAAKAAEKKERMT